MNVFLFFDIVGTGVFAISGALAAMNKKFDPFGVMILGIVTAVGGGSLRDVLIGRVPVGWMQDVTYLYVILVATTLAMMFRDRLAYLRKTIFLFDAIGLAIFTITGVEIGLQYDLHPLICLLLGTLSAAFGGVIRDMLCGQIPLIFHKEIYASVSLMGGSLFLLLMNSQVPEEIIYVLVSILMVTMRVLAVRRQWELPKFYS